MIDITGKYALITGSSRGIGQQIAIGLAQLGCHVVVHGRKQESCSKTLELLQAFDIKTFAVYGELSHEKELKQIVEQVHKTGLQIDILYNNAAIMLPYHADYWCHGWDDWMQTMKVNVYAMYYLCGAFIPEMRKNGFGRVVNLSSGMRDLPELLPYSVSKAAVEKLTSELASKLANSGVRINALDPGWLRTDLGGENAEYAVEAVLPGALEPVLIENDGPNGKLFSAIKHHL